jgi:predicted nucleic-acid-binding Zn-ribbon protein
VIRHWEGKEESDSIGFLYFEGEPLACHSCNNTKMERRILAFRPQTIRSAFIGVLGERVIAYACVSCGFTHLYATPDDEALENSEW